MKLLAKRAGARFLDVATYLIDCENRDVQGIKTLKSAGEIDEFTHVLTSMLPKQNIPVVVKIHEANS